MAIKYTDEQKQKIQKLMKEVLAIGLEINEKNNGYTVFFQTWAESGLLSNYVFKGEPFKTKSIVEPNIYYAKGVTQYMQGYRKTINQLNRMIKEMNELL
ncbi:hypothetical protein ACFSGI_08795 [Paenibacillus nicotianae]|uniref:Uncharacterized protein n=1 Tax=Paenibacillus nicotianae TaxID=1526551 RepID=A0ABW4UV95_9BACL